VNEFLMSLRKEGYSERRVKKYNTLLKKVYNRNWNPWEIGEEEIEEIFFYWKEKIDNEELSDETVKDYWLMFKNVVTYYNPELEKEFDKYKVKIKEKKINILTLEEVNSMIENTKSLRNKVLIALLYESGLRSQEIRGIEKKNVIFDEYGARIMINGKTGVRSVRVVKTASRLKKILEKKPSPFEMSCSGLTKIVKRIAENSGIEKNVYPHLFRHTRATHLSQQLTDREMCMYFGWSKNSNMPSHYAHLSQRDVDDKIIAISQQKETKQLEEVIYDLIRKVETIDEKLENIDVGGK